MRIVFAAEHSSCQTPAEIAAILEPAGYRVEFFPVASIVAAIKAAAIAGGRIDLVILPTIMPWDDNPECETQRLCKQIRGLDERLSFSGMVRARAVPILINLSGPSSPPDKNSGSMLEFDPPLKVRLKHEVVELHDASQWRYLAWSVAPEQVDAILFQRRLEILGELELMGYAITQDSSGRFTIGHLARRPRDGARVLGAATSESLRHSGYVLLREDFDAAQRPYQRLKFLLENFRTIATKKRVKPEQLFQRFFEEHPHFITKGAFEAYWSQPRLALPEDPKRYVEPDFVLRPFVAARLGTRWTVMDLKLPDDRLTVSRNFHQTFSHRLTKAVQQLRDYREYFNRPDTAPMLLQHFGYQPINPRLAVVIGTTQHDDGIARLQGPSTLDIEVVTYDEILELEERRLVLEGTVAGLLDN
jgi:hypothetical protein